MQIRAASAAAAIVVVALSTAACNPTTKSKASSTPTQVPVATETQADAASPAATTASQQTASSVPASASATASTPAASPSAPAPAAGGATINVCSLMTSAQASAINGVTYGAATPQRIGGIDVCDYKNTGQHVNELDIQDLNVQVISASDCYSQLLDAQGPGTKVSGVGDDAFGYEVGMVVKAGSRCIVISGLTSAEFRDNYAPDAAMAKIIISKLS